MLIDGLASFLLTTLVTLINLHFLYVHIPLMVVSFCVVATMITKINPKLSIVASIISYGISNVVFIISAAIFSLLFSLFKVDPSTPIVYLTLFSVILMFILLHLLFKIKRLKSGMPFITDGSMTNLGVMASVIILCSLEILTNNNGNLIYIIPICLVFICGVLIYLWWRRQLTKAYLLKQKEIMITELNNTIASQEITIRNLKHQNETLAKIIHQDNKLIPAMQMAVTSYLNSDITNTSEKNMEGLAILDYLNSSAQHRQELLLSHELKNKYIPKTNVVSLDSLLIYLSQKARQLNISVDFSFNCNTRYLVNHVIPENDLNSLLADLIENAMIATMNCDTKKIFINMNIVNNHYIIDIFDSGTPFEKNVLLNLGLNQITTHSDKSGSGIGLINIYKILQNHNASLLIEEFLPASKNYTKKVSIMFDKQCQYIIKTYRKDHLKVPSFRNDLTLLPIEITS